MAGRAHGRLNIASEIPQRSIVFLSGFFSDRRFATVTDTPVEPRAPRYRLNTFGTLALRGPHDDTVLGKHGHHRRRLALLAALAAAGEQGRSRDQLLLLFWPDVTQSRARHSLDQLLYALRTSIDESVFAGANPVRLNPETIASDVGAFAAALERGDFDTAVEEYRGPFLDGFYLGDAPEFESWVETERARLAGGYADALERLAQKAEAAQEQTTAVRWWRKLTEIDPVSSTNATGLIRALMNAGDHPAALQYAERYEAIVAKELGTSVGPALAGLVAEVRAESRTESVAVSKSSAAHRPTSPAETPTDGATPVGRLQPERVRRRRFVPYAFGAVVAVTVVMIATAAWLRASTASSRVPAAEQASIAVLPLANVSGDPQDAAIVDGLSEELITALHRIGNLRVIARSSAFAFRGRNVDARLIGDSLGVANILESSFQKVGTRLRVQMRLVDTQTGSTRWSERYDRELEDIFAVQSEIAAAVARELGLQLGPGAVQNLRRGPTPNVAAYDVFLRARDAVPVLLRSDSGPRQGLALLNQAVSLDSNFAAAYAHMPYMYFSLAGRAPTPQRVREIQQLAKAAAHKALSLDPSLPEAHAGLAVAHAIGLSDLAASEAAVRRAIALGGSPRVREHLSRVLMWSGRHAEALVEAQRAEKEDPLSPSAIANVGEALCVNGRY